MIGGGIVSEEVVGRKRREEKGKKKKGRTAKIGGWEEERMEGKREYRKHW